MRRILVIALLTCATLLRAEPGTAQTRQIMLSTLEWPPYTGQGLYQNGYAHQVVSRAFALAGLEPVIRFYPWARALQMAESGKADGAFPEYYAPQIRQDMLFSDAFPGGAAGLLKLRSNPVTLAPAGEHGEVSFAPLAGLHLGLVRGYVNHPTLDTDPLIRRSYARDDLQNLEKLLSRRVDLIFIDFNVARYLIDQTFAERAAEFEILQPALMHPTLHLIMPSQNPQSREHMASFNRGLKALRDSGELKRIMQSHGLQ